MDNLTPPILTVKVKCRDNPQCLFEGKDMFIDISITNNQQVDVGFPLEFAHHKGPTIKLVDTRTKRESYLSTHLADLALKDQFTWIKPGESVTMDWVIFAEEMEQFGGPYVDIKAEITVGEKVQIENKLVDFLGSDTIHIVSKDRPVA